MSGEKTEQPTPKRLRDARKKGQVAKSREIGSTANIMGVFVFLWIAGELFVTHCKELMVMGTQGYDAPFEEALKSVASGIATELILLTFPLLLLVIVLGIAANFFQVGALFAPELVKPDLKRLNPASAVKKIFSKKNLMEFIKSLLQIVFISILLYLVIKRALPDMLAIPYGGMEGIWGVSSSILKRLVIYSSLAFVTVAAADYFFQKSQMLKELRMTKEEVKQEYKEMEGDPLIKSKRKQFHRELLTNKMLQSVRKATVVVTNPTRLAVALFYDREEKKLPRVLAKGENLLAKRIVEIAREEEIPVMINVPLAQDLYARGNLNDYIPSELIEPVAEVLKWVYQLKSQRGG
jgi:type III secretion protein U